MFTLSIRLLLLCTLICSVPTFVNAQSSPSPEEDKLLASLNKLPPPPKSINDVLKLLNASKIDLEDVKRLTALSDSEPSPG
ncbi:MAG: hypothetical protein RLZZ173_1210, partial [Pseudomonadota bacterium]